MRFKNLKKKAKKPKSPSNSRSITEQSKTYLPKFSSTTFLKIYRISLKFFVVFIFILAAVIVVLDMHTSTQMKQSIDLEREKLAKELKFWEGFVAKHQDYRDAYFQASILEHRLGNTSKAIIHLEKGLSLDPNSEDGRKLEKFLVNK